MFKGDIYTLSIETDNDEISSITILKHTTEDSFEIVFDAIDRDEFVKVRTILELGKVMNQYDMLIVNDISWTLKQLMNTFPNMRIVAKLVDLQTIALYLNECMELSNFESAMFLNPVTGGDTTSWRAVADTYGFPVEVVGVDKNNLWFSLWCKHIDGLSGMMDKVL